MDRVSQQAVVRAAGGVVWRPGTGGTTEVLLVHRPRYGDWSLPKGKAAPDEDDRSCARREVEEETGLRCVLGEELAPSRYLDGRGRPKVVRYWVMRPEGGSFAPHGEVDAVRWLPVEEALEALTYDRDRAVVTAFAALAER